MNSPTVVIPVVIIVNACVWGFTMIMSSHILSGTGAYQEIQNILAYVATLDDKQAAASGDEDEDKDDDK